MRSDGEEYEGMGSGLYGELSLKALLARWCRDSSIDHCDSCDSRDTVHRESLDIERGRL
jgi:hypothetical protein